MKPKPALIWYDLERFDWRRAGPPASVGYMNPDNSDKPYSEALVLLIAFLIVVALGVFVHFRDHNGIRNVCKNHPIACAPAEYPGKVVEK